MNKAFPRSLVRNADELFCAEPRSVYFPYSERHLQSIWFDAQWRPKSLKTLRGEAVEVIHPGEWNGEAGPDFLRAEFSVAGQLMRGDVEVHVSMRDWKQHGHRGDPRYQNVRLHLVFFEGTPDPEQFPAGTKHLVLAPYLTDFDFEQIDLLAYPFSSTRPIPPCRDLMRERSEAERIEALLTAGEFRLRQKAERMRSEFQRHSPEQVLYAELLTALGYKQNKVPFRKLASLLPLSGLNQSPYAERLYALFLGVSNLLPSQKMGAQNQAEIRALWRDWFQVAGLMESREIGQEEWALNQVRPLNHPARRLAVASDWFRGERIIHQIRNVALMSDDPLDDWMTMLCAASNEFWEWRRSWYAPRSEARLQLIGKTRAAAILINVIVPWCAAMGYLRPFELGILAQLPVEELNRTMKLMAHRLFGPEYPRALLKSEVARQGLLHLYQTHCLAQGCAQCEYCLAAASDQDA